MRFRVGRLSECAPALSRSSVQISDTIEDTARGGKLERGGDLLEELSTVLDATLEALSKPSEAAPSAQAIKAAG